MPKIMTPIYRCDVCGKQHSEAESMFPELEKRQDNESIQDEFVTDNVFVNIGMRITGRKDGACSCTNCYLYLVQNPSVCGPCYKEDNKDPVVCKECYKKIIQEYVNSL